MKYILIIFITGFIAYSPIVIQKKYIKEQVIYTEKVLWSAQRKLTWGDFKGKKDTIDDLKKAETAFVIEIEKAYYNSVGIPTYEIVCYFLPELSWTITDNILALKHEQLHFDIGELYTRKIRKSFDSLTKNRVKNFEEYEFAFNTLYEECRYANEKYDSEVYFNEQKQKEWIEKITKEMEELKEYEYIPDED